MYHGSIIDVNSRVYKLNKLLLYQKATKENVALVRSTISFIPLGSTK